MAIDFPFMTQLASPEHCPVFVEAGPQSDKPVLVLLHGFMMSRAIWSKNLPHLSNHFRCVTMELLGHGRSGSPNIPQPYKMSSYIEAIDDVRKQLEVSKLSFCAHSFGAGIALSYGLSSSEQTDKIVFTNSRSALGTLKQKPGDLDRLKAALRANGSETLSAMPAHPRNMKEISPDIRQSLEQDAELLNPIGISHSMEVTARSTGLMDQLSNLECPALLINGTREKGFQKARDQVANQHPHIQIVDIDAGHSINAECPDLFNEVAASFLLSQSNPQTE